MTWSFYKIRARQRQNTDLELRANATGQLENYSVSQLEDRRQLSHLLPTQGGKLKGSFVAGPLRLLSPLSEGVVTPVSPRLQLQGTVMLRHLSPTW